MNAWILFTRSATLRNEPRLIARWLGKPNHRSTWFMQDVEVGVKCRWKRGRAGSHRTSHRTPVIGEGGVQ